LLCCCHHMQFGWDFGVCYVLVFEVPQIAYPRCSCSCDLDPKTSVVLHGCAQVEPCFWLCVPSMAVLWFDMCMDCTSQWCYCFLHLIVGLVHMIQRQFWFGVVGSVWVLLAPGDGTIVIVGACRQLLPILQWSALWRLELPFLPDSACGFLVVPTPLLAMASLYAWNASLSN
jgi:hypothetical protein